MGNFSNMFNFDNVGSKMKSYAKWSCWISIWLIWIGAIINFGVLVSNAWTASLCWIPILYAVLGPLGVWVGSWALYAFGECVEKTCDNERNTRLILKKLKEMDAEEKQVPSVIVSQVQRSDDNSETAVKEEIKVRFSPNATFEKTENGTIICQQCHFEQPESRKICWHCGAKFVEVENGHKWRCDNCGTLRSQTPCEHCGKE